MDLTTVLTLAQRMVSPRATASFTRFIRGPSVKASSYAKVDYDDRNSENQVR